MRTSTGQTSDQYWLLSSPCAGVRYEAIVQCVVLAQLECLFPAEKKKSPRGAGGASSGRSPSTSKK